MFDIGAIEIFLVMALALLVIGPEQLPEPVRTVARWLGHAKKTFNDFKSDLEKEIGMEEIQAQLRNDAIRDEFEKDKKALESLDEELKDANMDLMNSFNFSEEKKPQDSDKS